MQRSSGQVQPGEEEGGLPPRLQRRMASSGEDVAWPVPMPEVTWRGPEVAPPGRLPQVGGCVCWVRPTLRGQMPPTPTSA